MVSSTEYTYEMSNVGYVNIKWHSLKWLVIHVLHKDAVDDIEYSIYVTYEMNNVVYVNIILSRIL